MHYIFVVQRGRLETECVVFVEAMLRHAKVTPDRVTAFYPVNTKLWTRDPTPRPETFAYLASRGIRTVPIDNTAFGQSYPHANKVYALSTIEEGPVMFLDTDTLMLREPPELLDEAGFAMAWGGRTFPEAKSGFSIEAVWTAVYGLFGLEPGNTLIKGKGQSFDLDAYYMAGMIAVKEPKGFGQLYLDTCERIWKSGLPELAGEPIHPFLDQIALPVTVARMGRMVAQPSHEVVTFTPRKDACIWHYHYPHRLVRDGESMYGEKVRDILRDPDLSHLLMEATALVYWQSPQGRALYDKVRATKPEMSAEELIAALHRTGKPIR